MLTDEIKKRVTTAMKAGDTVARDVLRLALGEIQTAEARANLALTDEEAVAAVRKIVKSNEETLAHAADDPRAVDLRREIEVLTSLLPAQLSPDQIVAALAAHHEAIKAAKNDGQATGIAMKQLKSSGAEVNGNDVTTAVKKFALEVTHTDAAIAESVLTLIDESVKNRRAADHHPHHSFAPPRAAHGHDALELHFRKMTEYPLLTHEDEKSFARRIERADLSITRLLLGSAKGRAALLDLARAVELRAWKPEELERNTQERVAPRLRRLVEATEAKSWHSRTKPRAHGFRIHPKALLWIEGSLRARGWPHLAELERLRARGDEATSRLVLSNLRIVVTFARRYRGLPLVDLIQEGNFGLLRAIDKFDPRRGLRFSTYAAWWIRHALARALADQGKMIRLPVHLTGTVLRVRRAEERIRRETGAAPTPDDLVNRTGLPLAQVLRALDVVAQPVSLDAPLGEDAPEILDAVPDLGARAADEELADHQLREDTNDLIATLPDREAEVIRLRYGVGGGTQRTLEEIGVHLSLSRERARQIERDALRRLRVTSEKRGLRAHIQR